MALRALVTGITGFVGGHLAEHLVRQGDEVLGVSRQPVGPQTVPSVAWDLARPIAPDARARILAFRPDIVFHLGALSHPPACGIDRPTEGALAVNVEGTQRVLDLIEQFPAPGPRLVFTSSCHVYELRAGDPFVAEDAPISPSTPYGETKVLAERAIRERVETWSRETRLSPMIVRPFHQIGPRQPPHRMLTDWILQLQRARNEEKTSQESLRPNGENGATGKNLSGFCSAGPPIILRIRNDRSFLDLLDVRDGARALRRLATTKPSAPELLSIYNLGSGVPSRSGQILETLLQLTRPLFCREIKLEVESSDEEWNPIAIIRKLTSVGWRPEIEYVQTLRDMW